MRIKHTARVILVLSLLALLPGCKLALVVVEGGSLGSDSGLYSCQEGNNCLIEITSADFTETFIALPNEGYEFVKWLSGDNMLCGGSTDPRCVVDNRPLASVPGADAVITSDRTFYLLPVFSPRQAEPDPPDTAALSPALQAKFDGSCARCHINGQFGAPRIHVASAWASRLDKGLDVLVRSVRNGLGAMPAGGGCSNCSDAEYRDMIIYMSGPGD